MSNLACLLKKRGYLVSGSDLDTFGPSALLLEKHKIRYFKNHNPKNIQAFKPDMVVIGNAIKRGNPSLEYVLNKQIPYCSMPEIIKEEIIKNKKSIVVAGTSGKTTTTALLAWIFKESGLKPAALVGGILENTDSGFMAGDGKYVIIEGDEYDSCFYDSSPKFLHYKPYIALINNIQPDHLDIYGSLENIYKAFRKLVSIIPSESFIVLNKTDQYTTAIMKELKSKALTFSKNGDVWANDIKPTPAGLSFVIFKNAKRLGAIKSPLLGKHNIENILAATTIATELKIPFPKIQKAMAGFKGVKRRLEIISRVKDVIIVDDFAHNPDKVFASLSALRDHFPKHQLIAIFEPRTGSSRRKFFQDTYLSSFKPADRVYVGESYKISALNKKEAFSNHQLAKDLNKNGIETYALKNADQIVAHLKKSFARIQQRPTIIAIMTSGEFDNIHKKLVELTKRTK